MTNDPSKCICCGGPLDRHASIARDGWLCVGCGEKLSAEAHDPCVADGCVFALPGKCVTHDNGDGDKYGGAECCAYHPKSGSLERGLADARAGRFSDGPDMDSARRLVEEIERDDLEYCLEKAIKTGGQQDHIGWLVKAIRILAERERDR